MKPFLESFAHYLIENHFHDLSESCVIFPSRRAGIYFTKHFAENCPETTFLPKISTLNEFISDLSEIQSADQLQLLYLLYDVFKKQIGIDESFDEFYFWGQVILADFNDIDKEQADAKRLYSNLSDLKEIENTFNDWSEEQIRAIEQFWGVMDDKSEVPAREKFLLLWEKLFPVYDNYNNILDQQNIGYEGKIYKHVYKLLEENKILKTEFKHIFIVGFNALSKAEKKILTSLKKISSVEFFWDYDEYYYSNKEHEAGYFLRSLVNEFPSPEKFIFESGILHKKQINLYAVPTQVGQAKILPEILMKNIGNTEQTAVVLADENMLFPVLYSIPENIKQLNVTMGFPVKQSPAMQLIEGLLFLQLNCKSSANGNYFKTKAVLQVLNLPYIKELPWIQEIENELIGNSRNVIISEKLWINEFSTCIFSFINSPDKYCAYLSKIILEILESGKENLKADHRKLIDKQILYSVYKEIQKLDEILNIFDIKFSKHETFVKIFKQYLSNVTVAFKGEPLAGLQIMGILESRLLDFKNIILLSVNEGIFPKTSAQLSLIPYNLRKGFGLLTQEHQDAIFSYHFYHMLQRTENLSLVYSTKQNDFGKSDVSRYIHQLKFDERIELSEFNVTDKAGMFVPKPISVKRNERIAGILNAYLTGEKHFSPTSLSFFINCRLKFYFRYMAGLKVPDEIPEEMDGKLFGRILHLALEILYKPFVNQLISKAEIEILTSDLHLNSALDLAFNQVLAGGKSVDHNSGKLLLNYQILKNYAKRVIEFDSTMVPFLLKGFELPVNYTIPIKVDSQNYNIGFQGYIDRMIEKDGKIFIQDFKTGNVETKTNEMDDLFKETEKKDFAAIRQVLIYAVSQNDKNVKPQILSVRKSLTDEDVSIFIAKEQIDNVAALKEEFKIKLIDSVSQIFTIDEFKQTEFLKNCEWCDFKQICRR